MKDGRSLLAIPLVAGPAGDSAFVSHLLLFEVAFSQGINAAVKMRALGERGQGIKNLVEEAGISWCDDLLDAIGPEDLFGQSAEKTAEQILASLKPKIRRLKIVN